MVGKDVALKLIEGKAWHHDFEIVGGVRTHGNYSPAGLWHELQLPADMNGMALADVGACNGYFSFEARKRGAHVVAFDVRHKDNSGFGLAQHINGLTDIEYRQINILDVRPDEDGPFDIVLAMGLLYHTPDPYRALVNCAGLSRERLVIESYCIDALLPPSSGFRTGDAVHSGLSALPRAGPTQCGPQQFLGLHRDVPAADGGGRWLRGAKKQGPR